MIGEAEGNFANGLNGVDVEEGSAFGTDLGDFFDREKDAGFVVGPDEGDDGGVVPNGGANGFRIEGSVRRHGQPSNSVALAFEVFGLIFDGGVFD